MDRFHSQGSHHELIHVGPKKGVWLDAAVSLRKPDTALEFGTQLGYSAIRIARLLPEGGHLWTIEPNPDNANLAEANIEHTGLASRITVLRGTFDDVWKDVPCPVGLIFLDHSRAAYLRELKGLERWGYVTAGTVVVADNIGGEPGSHGHSKAEEYANHVRNAAQFCSTFHFGDDDGIEVSEFHGGCGAKYITPEWCACREQPVREDRYISSAPEVKKVEGKRKVEGTMRRWARKPEAGNDVLPPRTAAHQEDVGVAQDSQIVERRRNYDPANYPASTPKTQEFIFGTPKWQRPSIPAAFKISDDLIIDKYLTDGTFGRCFSLRVAPDSKEWGSITGGLVAKVMRPIAKQNQYYGDAEVEASYLSRLMSHKSCPESIVKFFGSVIFPDPLNTQRRFHALIFEVCAASLHAFWQDCAKRQSWHPDDICTISCQLLQCCAFLHGQGFVHTDLKHKNIMLKSSVLREGSLRPLGCGIRVIDFGNMTHADDYHTQPIGTRQFRAPEIQLGLDWDEKFDLWGTGCVLHWMHEARTVFEPHSEAEQLELMEILVGATLPEKLIARSKKHQLFVNGELRRRIGRGAVNADLAGKDWSKTGGRRAGNTLVPISAGVKVKELRYLLLDLFELDPLDRLPAAVLLEKHAAYFDGLHR